MKIKITILITLLLTFYSYGQNKTRNPKAIIELDQVGYEGWEPVIEIKNCVSDRDMAIDVVEGLALAQLKNGCNFNSCIHVIAKWNLIDNSF